MQLKDGQPVVKEFVRWSHIWRCELIELDSTFSRKYSVQLRNSKTFDKRELLYRYKLVSKSMDEFHEKVKEYKNIFKLNNKEYVILGISQSMVNNYRRKFKQRYKTLKT